MDLSFPESVLGQVATSLEKVILFKPVNCIEIVPSPRPSHLLSQIAKRVVFIEENVNILSIVMIVRFTQLFIEKTKINEVPLSRAFKEIDYGVHYIYIYIYIIYKSIICFTEFEMFQDKEFVLC